MSGAVFTLYGIPSCDTVKRARAWLTASSIEHVFHDFKTKGVPLVELDVWIQRIGWDALVNKKGTTWRKLDPATQAAIVDAKSARALMLREPSIIKRPVAMFRVGAADMQLSVGYVPDAWASWTKS
ncbi:hypothetical protein BH09MYX1_BH09MYX1_16100 [soil metagenome]